MAWCLSLCLAPLENSAGKCRCFLRGGTQARPLAACAGFDRILESKMCVLWKDLVSLSLSFSCHGNAKPNKWTLQGESPECAVKRDKIGQN